MPLMVQYELVDTSFKAYISVMVRAVPNLVLTLENRRKSLGLSCAQLAALSGLGLRTVQRVLSGSDSNATLATLSRIADVLGMTIGVTSADLNDVRRRRAQAKAKRLVGMVQGTMGLEAAALEAGALSDLEQKTVRDLLSGSNRRLWED